MVTDVCFALQILCLFSFFFCDFILCTLWFCIYCFFAYFLCSRVVGPCVFSLSVFGLSLCIFVHLTLFVLVHFVYSYVFCSQYVIIVYLVCSCVFCLFICALLICFFILLVVSLVCLVFVYIAWPNSCVLPIFKKGRVSTSFKLLDYVSSYPYFSIFFFCPFYISYQAWPR